MCTFRLIQVNELNLKKVIIIKHCHPFFSIFFLKLDFISKYHERGWPLYGLDGLHTPLIGKSILFEKIMFVCGLFPPFSQCSMLWLWLNQSNPNCESKTNVCIYRICKHTVLAIMLPIFMRCITIHLNLITLDATPCKCGN